MNTTRIVSLTERRANEDMHRTYLDNEAEARAVREWIHRNPPRVARSRSYPYPVSPRSESLVARIVRAIGRWL